MRHRALASVKRYPLAQRVEYVAIESGYYTFWFYSLVFYPEKAQFKFETQIGPPSSYVFTKPVVISRSGPSWLCYKNSRNQARWTREKFFWLVETHPISTRLTAWYGKSDRKCQTNGYMTFWEARLFIFVARSIYSSCVGTQATRPRVFHLTAYFGEKKGSESASPVNPFKLFHSGAHLRFFYSLLRSGSTLDSLWKCLECDINKQVIHNKY